MINLRTINWCYTAHERAKRQHKTQYIYEDRLGTVVCAFKPPENVIEFLTVTEAGRVTRILKSIEQSSFVL